MSRFEDLPLDVIREIFGPQDAKVNLCNFRRVSKCFNALIYPMLFTTLNLDFKDITRNKPDVVRCREIITALASGTTTAFQHTRQLRFDASRIYNSTEALEDVHIQKLVVERIFAAISSLKDLQIMDFYVSAEYPEHLTDEVMRALGTLAYFRGFNRLTLGQSPPKSFTLKPLSNLAIFRMSWGGCSDDIVSDISSFLTRCPDLSELYLGNDSSSLRELFAKFGMMEGVWNLNELQLRGIEVRAEDIKAHGRHLKNLTCLEIGNNTSPTADTDFGTICGDLLQEQGVLLKRIITDYPEDALLLEYLCSYSGLTKLRFGAKGKVEVSEAVNDRVYMEILPRHSETLEHLQLYVGPSLSGLVTEEQRMGLLKCQRVRILQINISLSWEQLLRNNKATLEYWLDVGLELPDLVHLELVSERRGHAFSTVGVCSKRAYYRIQVLREVIGRYRKTKGMQFLVNGL